jgi:hypothetical protein
LLAIALVVAVEDAPEAADEIAAAASNHCPFFSRIVYWDWSWLILLHEDWKVL